jgi:hypothetical protein
VLLCVALPLWFNPPSCIIRNSLFGILRFPPYFCRINLSLTHRKIHLLQLTNYMRRIVLTALAFCAVHFVFAQDTTIVRKTVPTPTASVGGNDHLLLQLGYTQWQGKPDSIKTKGLSRTFNMYFMFAFPFKTNPHLSVALGPGFATDHMFFDKMDIGITRNTSTVHFDDVSDTTHFKKYKLSTAFLEAPVELRYSSNPLDDKRSVKVALGVKVGTMLAGWTKGKTEVNSNGNTLRSYTDKEKSKHFFNTNRLSVMGRIGYGKFSLFTSYAITPVFKEGVGPTVRPLTIGLTLSGL